MDNERKKYLCELAQKAVDDDKAWKEVPCRTEPSEYLLKRQFAQQSGAQFGAELEAAEFLELIALATPNAALREALEEKKQWIRALWPYVIPFHNPSCGLLSKSTGGTEYKCDCEQGANFEAALSATPASTRPVRIDPDDESTWPPLRSDSVQRSVLVRVGRNDFPSHEEFLAALEASSDDSDK